MRGRRVSPLLLLAALCCLAPAARAADRAIEIPDSWASPSGIDDPVSPPEPAEYYFRARAISPAIAGPAGLIGTVPSPFMQSEVSLAAWGPTVLVGTNDVRWPSLGGYMRSVDGGDTYVDGGPFAVPAGWTGNGDPAFAVWDSPGGPIFYFAQLLTAPGTLRQIGLFRSVDGGFTWAGPFTIAPTLIPGESPDRHSITVDPETGRLFVAWTHFGAPFSIRVTYSDDAPAGVPPTWAPATFVGLRPQDGQATTIVADPFSDRVYLAWQTFWAGPPDRGVALVRSADNGLTWDPPFDIGPLFSHHIAPYGFDRFLWSFSGSSIALNPADGSLVMVYAASATGTPAGDFGDIYFRRSVDLGLTWSAPVPLNVFPGVDRAQCFPAVACTRDGRIDVVWYDQSAGSGRSDYTDLMYCFSTDLGATWSSPVPATPSPMHCESGNNFSFPHQGDYIDVTANEGPGGLSLGHAGFAAFAPPSPFTTGANPMGFTRGTAVQVAPLRNRPGSILIADHGCATDDGVLVAAEVGDLTIPLENIGRSGLTGISATLSTSTPGVAVIVATRAYPPIASGGSAGPVAPFQISLAPAFPCGTDIQCRLDISAAGVAPTYIEFVLPTGIVTSSTVLLSESFDAVVAPALPPGWTSVSAGSTVNNWVTTPVGPSSAPNAAFAPTSPGNSFARLFGPTVAVPAGTNYIDVRFQTNHDLRESDARFAPDGASFEYQLNGAGGSHFGSGDATEIDYRYTHNIARASGSNSGDRHGWSGISSGYQAARFRFPNMAGQTMQPRFDLTATGGGVGGVGLWVDDVQITAYTLGCGTCVPTATLVQRFDAEPRGESLELRWSSSATDRIAGWNLDRSTSPSGPWERINPEPIPMGAGGEFRYEDRPSQSGTLYYRLCAKPIAGLEFVLQIIPVELSAAPRTLAFTIAGENPFRELTYLRYALPTSGPVRIELFSVTGQRVRTVAEEFAPAGVHTVALERRGSDGSSLAAGIYLVRVQHLGRSRTLRVIALD